MARCRIYLLPWGKMISTSPSKNSGNPAALAAQLTGARLMRRVDPPANDPVNRDLLAGGGPAGDDTGDERTCFSPVGNTGIVLQSG